MVASWELWRQDEHGNEFCVRAFDDLKAAELARDELIARGHHQHYWLVLASSGQDRIERLKGYVQPPARPGNSDARLHADGRELALPADYIALMTAYGPGSFDDYVFILSVGHSRPFYDIVEATRASARDLIGHRELLDNRWPPYPLWPAKRALVKWGTIANEHDLYWLTDGEPDRWPVVVLRENEQLHELVTITATDFLLRLLEGPAPSELVGVALADGVSEFVPGLPQ